MTKALTPLLAILVSGAIGFFYVLPLYNDAQAVQVHIDEHRDTIEKASAFNAQLEALLSERNSISARELERLEQLVPDEVEVFARIVDIEALAEVHNLFLSNVSLEQQGDASDTADDLPDAPPTRSLSADDFAVTTLHFSVLGSYEQFRAFLAALEQSVSAFEITNVGFDVTEGDLIIFTLSVELYALTPSAQ